MIWKDLIKYFISFVTIYFIFNQYGNNIYNILTLIDIRYILLIIFLSFIQYMISAYRWMYISRFTNLDIGFFYSLKFYYISSFMNNILPGGIVGDIFRIYHSADNKKEILKMGKSFQSVIFNSAAALNISENTKNLQDGARLAADALLSGKTKKLIESLKSLKPSL